MCRFLMSFRITSTGMPRIARRRVLVGTLILHDLEHGVGECSIAQYRLHGVANLALLESVTSPVRLLHCSDHPVKRKRCPFSWSRTCAVLRHSAKPKQSLFQI